MRNIQPSFIYWIWCHLNLSIRGHCKSILSSVMQRRPDKRVQNTHWWFDYYKTDLNYMLLQSPGGLNPSKHIQTDMRESASIHHTITKTPRPQCNSLTSKVKCSVCIRTLNSIIPKSTVYQDNPRIKPNQITSIYSMWAPLDVAKLM